MARLVPLNRLARSVFLSALASIRTSPCVGRFRVDGDHERARCVRVGSGLGIDVSFTVLTADASVARRPFTSRGDQPDCDTAPIPLPLGGNIEGNSDYHCADGGDCHLLVYQSADVRGRAPRDQGDRLRDGRRRQPLYLERLQVPAHPGHQLTGDAGAGQ